MKSASKAFESPLADAIQKFLIHKRALHKKFFTEEKALRLFDRYLVCAGISRIDEITSEVLNAFICSRPRARPRSYNHLVGVIRRLFNWLVVQEILKTSPLTAKTRRSGSELKPHILRAAQVKQLLALAAELPDAQNAIGRGVSYRLMFALLYGLGLRVGEVCRLRIQDVDLTREILSIKETKFSKSRFVPMGPILAQQLRTYLADQSGLSNDAFVFSFDILHRRPVNTCTISQIFHQLSLKLGHRAEPGEREPRLHDLRHSFATNTLLRLYREGKDPSLCMFQLSTFLGHSQLASTAVYLTITGDLLTEAGKRFESFAAPVIKDVTL
ncbi:MAG: tyrosine-type recombinase/integrase [Candidatus Obscuribacterales bacterium]